MIEPTESESKEELDLFIDAMKSIAKECEEEPETVLNAPHTTRISRLDEVRAATKADPALEEAGEVRRGVNFTTETQSHRKSCEEKRKPQPWGFFYQLPFSVPLCLCGE